MRILIALVVVGLAGCIFSEGDGGPTVLGYPTGASGSILGKAKGDTLIAWRLSKDLDRKDTFYVYVNVRLMSERQFTKSRTYKALGAYPDQPAILDAGDQCLTIHQTGKDTVRIDGKPAIVEVPIEPCMPYLLDKDIP